MRPGSGNMSEAGPDSPRKAPPHQESIRRPEKKEDRGRDERLFLKSSALPSCVCLCMTCVPDAQGGQKGASDPLDLRLGLAASHQVGCAHQAQVLCKSSQCCQLLSHLSGPRLLFKRPLFVPHYGRSSRLSPRANSMTINQAIRQSRSQQSHDMTSLPVQNSAGCAWEDMHIHGEK